MMMSPCKLERKGEGLSSLSSKPKGYPLPWCDLTDRPYWRENLNLFLTEEGWWEYQRNRDMGELIPMIYNILVKRTATYDEVIELSIEADSEYEAINDATDACCPGGTAEPLRFVPLTQELYHAVVDEVLESEIENDQEELSDPT
jgi:hypothetical protein